MIKNTSTKNILDIYIHNVHLYTVFLLAATESSLKTESMGVTLGRKHAHGLSPKPRSSLREAVWLYRAL